MTELTNAERAAVEALPYRLASEAVNVAVNGRIRLCEIRLRKGQPLTVTSCGKNYYSRSVLCTAEDIELPEELAEPLLTVLWEQGGIRRSRLRVSFDEKYKN